MLPPPHVGCARSPGTHSGLLQGKKPSHGPSGLLRGRQKPPPCPRVLQPPASAPGGPLLHPALQHRGPGGPQAPPGTARAGGTTPAPGSQRRAPLGQGRRRRGVKRGHSGRIVRLDRTRSLWKQRLIPFHPPSRPSAVFQAFRRQAAETGAIVSAAPQPPPSVRPSIPAACPHPAPTPAPFPAGPSRAAQRWGCQTHAGPAPLHLPPSSPSPGKEEEDGKHRASHSAETHGRSHLHGPALDRSPPGSHRLWKAGDE